MVGDMIYDDRCNIQQVTIKQPVITADLTQIGYGANRIISKHAPEGISSSNALEGHAKYASHALLENVSAQLQSALTCSRSHTPPPNGIAIRWQKNTNEAISKKNIIIGEKIRLPSAVPYEKGNPHAINMGNEMSDKKDWIYKKRHSQMAHAFA